MKDIKKQSESNDLLKFERLLSNISSTFTSTSFENTDEALNGALRKVSEFLEVDRSGVSEYLGKGNWKYLHIWTAPDLFPRVFVGDTYTNNDYPWILKKVLHGDIVHIPSAKELPEHLATTKAYCEKKDVKSELDIPIVVSDVVLGTIGFVSERSERRWSLTIIQRCKLIGYIFAGILMRKRAELELRQAELRYRTVADFAYDWEYWQNPDATLQYVSPSCQRITGYKQEDFINNPNLLMQIIIPNDQHKWKRHNCMNREYDINPSVQFRIKKKNGQICWIEHACRPVSGIQGDYLGVRANNRDITKRKRTEEKLKNSIVEIKRLKDRLQTENVYLRNEMEVKYQHKGIIGQSHAIKKVLNQIEQVAPTNATVLLLGETGTGKELLARAIHNLSNRKERAMVKLICSALPPTLIESELFGVEKGAYTGAELKRKGRFEIADQSTLFLDEIGELTVDLQTKLLRVLEGGEFERLGGTKTLKSDVRIIAATNKTLDKAIHDGKFRKDLYYRLNVFPIDVPPLRDRQEDIPLLLWAFVKEFGQSTGNIIDFISSKSINQLKAYSWPGNIRELRNIIERAMIMSSEGTLNIHIPGYFNTENESDFSLEYIERKHILSVLNKTGWRIMGKKGAAEILGLNRTTLYSRMKKLGIRRT